MKLNIFYSDRFNFHLNIKEIKRRLLLIAFFERRKIKFINLIIVGDREIILINKKYFKHNYPTDIITFNYSNSKEIIGDIFISLNSIKYNASKFNNNIDIEIYRIIIHGILHLFNYRDKKKNEKLLMKKLENLYLKLFYKY